MDVKKVIIVGGVAGGASAAARLRRNNENVEIIMFEKGEHISFANCGLPYYIGNVIEEKEKLFVQTPERMKARFNIDVRVNSEVISINTETKQIEVLDKVKNIRYKESFDKLILSPGAEPIKPPIPGADSKKIFTLRNVPDTFAIKEYIEKNSVKRAVVVGAGYIGIEMAENLHQLGINVTIVELSDHVMGPLDYDMATLVHQHMKTKNIEFYLNDGVKNFSDNDRLIVELNSGKSIRCDMAVLAIGVKPEIKLAKECGLSIGQRVGIEVNEYLQTSNPDIYAVGDVIEVTDYISNSKAVIPLAGPANKQGRIAANNICGASEKYSGTQGTSIIKVFDITVAGTGNNEALLKRNNIPYLKTYIHSSSHAGYYPGASPLSIKVLFAPDNGKVLGAQIIGYEGVDKRIDVIATAIRGNMTVYDLEELELSYAPPYSSAKDPVNIAGFTAVNILKDDHRVIYWNEVDSRDENSVLVDVRTPMEYKLGTISNAINIQVDELRSRINELPKDKKIIIFCEVGLRGYIAYRMLIQNNFTDVVNLSGGYKTYSLAKAHQSNTDIFNDEKIMQNDLIKAYDKNEPIAKHEFNNSSNTGDRYSIKVNACGLQCPGPILQVYSKISEIHNGDIIEVTASDPGFESDIKVWCSQTRNELLKLENDGKIITAVIKKHESTTSNNIVITNSSNEKTLIVFSNDLDRAIASFIIANGAVAMGSKVTIFFTFWGLNVIKKSTRIHVSKNFIEKMFDYMLPRSSEKLKLSKINMGGIGSKLIRFIMRRKNVPSLENLISQAQSLGVRFVACNMSMDLMGIRREELLDGVEVGGVATFLASADKSNMSLFI